MFSKFKKLENLEVSLQNPNVFINIHHHFQPLLINPITHFPLLIKPFILIGMRGILRSNTTYYIGPQKRKCPFSQETLRVPRSLNQLFLCVCVSDE